MIGRTIVNLNMDRVKLTNSISLAPCFISFRVSYQRECFLLQETYGEDPFLAGKLVQNFVRGLQGSDARYVRIDAGCKHLDVHGGPENIPVDRFSFDAKVKELLDHRASVCVSCKGLNGAI